MVIKVDPPYEMLFDVANGYLSTSSGVRDVIQNIEKVQRGELEKFSWGGSDYCIIDTYKDESNISYDFGENETSVPTPDILKLMKDWERFLVSNGK